MSPLFSFSNLKIQFSGLTFILNKRLRIWATQQLREYIVKGFVLDDERLKNPDQPFDYFEELLPNPNGIESISLKIQNLRRTRDLLLARLLSGQVELSTAEVSA